MPQSSNTHRSGTRSKASASILAVDERQSLEAFTREEKTANRAFAQLKEKHQDLDQKREKLSEDARVHSGRGSEVHLCSWLYEDGW
jgi:structural maintenance of chromosome 1